MHMGQGTVLCPTAVMGHGTGNRPLSHVSMLYRQRYILTEQMAQDYYEQFPKMFSSASDVEFLFALMNTDREHWGDRPLAKLTHDIREEIDELYADGKGRVNREM